MVYIKFGQKPNFTKRSLTIFIQKKVTDLFLLQLRCNNAVVFDHFIKKKNELFKLLSKVNSKKSQQNRPTSPKKIRAASNSGVQSCFYSIVLVFIPLRPRCCLLG